MEQAEVLGVLLVGKPLDEGIELSLRVRNADVGAPDQRLNGRAIVAGRPGIVRRRHPLKK